MIKRRTKVKEEVPPVEITLPEGLVLGTNISYYLEGWRVGRLDGLKRGRATVMPVRPYKATEGNHITVLLEDIKKIEIN